METGALYDGYKSSITGVEKEYGQGYKLNVSLGDAPGCAGQTANQAMDGAVIVRVPASLAAGVDPTTYNDITTFDLAKQAAKDAAKSAVKEAVKDKRKKR